MTDQWKYVKSTFKQEGIASRFLGEERKLRVYLPPGYQELLSYPVLYCQDGDDFFRLGRIATITNYLILELGMEPIIIVGVGVKKSIRTQEYSPQGRRFIPYTQFFTQELIPYIEEKYPIRTAAEYRILAGDSLGATVSLHLALDYPDLFRNLISLSGAFFPSTQKRIKQEDHLSDLRIYMLVGLDETQVETPAGTFNFLEINRETKELLIQRQASVQYIEKPGRHIWGFWQKEIPNALMYYFSNHIHHLTE
ncbi:esterase family protein [Microaerobacter geothermalis]|uniref:alpha/beta hydrolase n=1 Tax=Microaerobacter geothermalis TaxID=674972 RepID=UPI001EEAA5BF|nr:alpha/beta hydrolase-fold protein [Microaerobacter geothermalis]MCF6092928.1 esterase family protein [Microaerobacter geothermalis]